MYSYEIEQYCTVVIRDKKKTSRKIDDFKLSRGVYLLLLCDALYHHIWAPSALSIHYSST